jgi:peroxiredoxin
MTATGDTAPDFTLKDQNADDVTLSSLRGQPVVIVFYPFTFTGVCEGELCEIRDDPGAFERAGAQVLAISCDTRHAQRMWAEQQGFTFPVLSDFWPHGAVAQSYRFAAADGASTAFRPKAVSWVMAGGVFAGVLGPQLVQWTMDIWPPYLFAFSFVVQAFVALVAMAVLWGVDAPKPAPSDLHGGRPLLEIVRQPRFIAAAFCGIVSHPMMNLVMTSAPLAMKMCGLSVSDSNFGIQWHIVAMYGPSFFTGSLIARFGAPRIVALGLSLEAAGAMIGLSGITAMHFWATLIVLGVGWNFSFVGASALVLETHRPQERNKVQAFNDFLVFGMMAVGSFSSGQLLANYGWSAVNMVVFPPVLLGLAVLSFASFARRRARLQAVDEFPEPSI